MEKKNKSHVLLAIWTKDVPVWLNCSYTGCHPCKTVTSSGRVQQPPCHKHADLCPTNTLMLAPQTYWRLEECTNTSCSAHPRCNFSHKQKQTPWACLRGRMLVMLLSGRNEIENTTSEKQAEVHITCSCTPSLSLSLMAISTNPSCNVHEAQPLFFHTLPLDFSIILQI